MIERKILSIKTVRATVETDPFCSLFVRLNLISDREEELWESCPSGHGHSGESQCSDPLYPSQVAH